MTFQNAKTVRHITRRKTSGFATQQIGVSYGTHRALEKIYTIRNLCYFYRTLKSVLDKDGIIKW